MKPHLLQNQEQLQTNCQLLELCRRTPNCTPSLMSRNTQAAARYMRTRVTDSRQRTGGIFGVITRRGGHGPGAD